MTPREFLNIIVRPNVDDFHSNFGSLRHAYNVVSALDALAAQLYVWAKLNAPPAVASDQDDSAYRNTLAHRNRDFALLRDIAKAQKHVYLARHRPKLTKADQVLKRAIGQEGGFGEGHYGRPQQVVVDIAPDFSVYVQSVVDYSLAFLEAEMGALGA